MNVLSKRLLTRAVLSRRSGALAAQATTPARLIVSDAYFGLEEFKEKQMELRRSMADTTQTVDKIRKIFERDFNSVKNLTSTDLELLVPAATGEEDIRLLAAISKSFIAEGRRAHVIHEAYHMLFSLCNVHNCVEVANEVWDDVKARVDGTVWSPDDRRIRRLKRLYAALLYKNLLYEQLADFAEDSPDHMVAGLYALASLYKIGTDEAFARASALYCKMEAEAASESDRSKPRVPQRYHQIYALFAMRVGELGLAHDVLWEHTDGKSPIHKCLKLDCLVRSGHLDHAVDYLASSLVGPSYPYLPYELVERLAEQVKERRSQQPDSSIPAEWEALLPQLNPIVRIDKTLEQVVLEPKKARMPVRHRTRNEVV